ncbi:MAG: T9SS type A sorting domain-containing protein [Bacteroidales bacterium]|nr:T9SS type A sorting domain-containing protein [Bacteroidales bacterium]
MKKAFLLLFCSLFAIFSLNAQTVVLEEDFSLVGADSNHSVYNNLDQYTQIPGWTGNWVYTSTEKLRVGKSSAGGFLMTPALNLSGNNGSFTVTFDVKAWSASNECTNMYVLVVNGTDSVVETVNGLSTSQFQTITLPFTGGANGTKIKFKSYQETKARFFIDNIVITSVESGPDTIAPHISSVNPSSNLLAVAFNEALDPTSAQNANNYALDNNISITSATMSGNTVSLAVSPALVEGNSYTLVVSNVADVAGNVMTAPESITFTYGVSPDFQMANIAQLRTKLDCSDNTVNIADNVEYKLTGEVIVTAVAAHNNQKVLQDASGAVLVYDPSGVLGSLEVGDKVKGLYGTLTNYYGFLEFKPTQAYETLVSVYQDVEPLTITLGQLNDQSFMIQHQAELIKLNDVTFTSPGTFAVLNTYEITQSGTTATAVYPYFQDANIIGTDIPTGNVSITGFNFATGKIGSNYYDFRYYIVPRSTNDFSTGIINYVNENDVTVAPNPAVDQIRISVSNDQFQVSHCYIIDINGNVVASQNVEDNAFSVNVNQLASGFYFLRLTDGKSNVTTKFVKK